MNTCITALFLRNQLQLRAIEQSMQAKDRELGVSVTTSSAFTTEIGSTSFSELSENCVILPCKIKRCGSTCVYTEENGSKLYLAFHPECN